MSDPILLWNEVALEANRVSHTNGQGEQAGPPLSARALAIVHLAMYDAYAGCIDDPALPQYIVTKPLPPAKTPPEAAVAAAAYTTLAWLYPSQRPAFDIVLQATSDDPTSPAHQYGVAVAKAIQAEREHDPGVGSATYRPSLERGKHRPDPDNIGQGFHGPDYGKLSSGFGIKTRFELAKPPFNDSDYQTALTQVRGMGIKPDLAGTLPAGTPGRTVDGTTIGLFWGYDGAFQIGTPPRLYNQIIRAVARNQKNSVAANARSFAFVNVAMADAGILAWDQKYKYEFWRPVLGVREHDVSMGPGSSTAHSTIDDGSDPLWLPLGAPLSNRIGKNFTPNFPAYPSGHATFGAAALHITRLFYGQGGTFNKGDLTADKLFDGLDFVSEELDGITTDNTGAVRPKHTRKFPDGLWGMIEENGRSRMFLGVHWIFDAFVVTAKDGKPDLYRKDKDGRYYGGVALGLQVAEDVFGKGVAPTKSTVGPRPATSPLAGRVPTYSSSYPR